MVSTKNSLSFCMLEGVASGSLDICAVTSVMLMSILRVSFKASGFSKFNDRSLVILTSLSTGGSVATVWF